MKRFWLIILFVLVLVTTLVSTMPLSFVLEKSGVRETGLSWQRAEGTIFKGEITGLAYASQPLGKMELSFRPRDLLSGRLGYAIHLDGPAISGTANIAVNRSVARVSGLNGKAAVNQLVYLIGGVRIAGGEIKISDADIEFDIAAKECAAAAGRVTSNMLDRLAVTLADQNASELAGNIACGSGALTLLMEGVINRTDPVTLDGVLSANDRSRVEVKVQTLDVALAAGLDLYGFEQEGEGYIMRQEVVALGGLING